MFFVGRPRHAQLNNIYIIGYQADAAVEKVLRL